MSTDQRASLRANLLHFEPFSLDLDVAELRRAGRVVRLPALPARLLCYLAANRHRTVSKRELAREVWGATAVEEATLHQAVRAARRAVDDDGRRQRVIGTAAGVGYRFVAETREDPALLAPAREPPFVGQRALLAAAEPSIASVVAGSGSILLISGGAGAGKTRSAAKVARLASAQGLLVVRGGASPHGGAPPFWPWIEAFRELSGLRPLDELRREAPHLISIDPPPGAPPGESQRFRHFNVAARCLIGAADRAPLALLLEDVHEANASTLELLEYIGRQNTRAPLLLVATFRARELAKDGARARALASIEALPNAVRHEIAPLSPIEIAYLVEQHSGRSFPLERIESLAKYTGGNPFFSVELARILPDDETLRSESAWEAWLPRGAAQLLADRLAQLNAEDRSTLAAAAAIGTSFDAAVLAHAAPDRDTRRAITAGVADGLVVELPPHAGTYRFAHAMIRDALYADFADDSERREATHLRIAGAILAAEASRESEAAYHLCSAGAQAGSERIAAAVESAAARTARAGDLAGAYSLYTHALDIVDAIEPRPGALHCGLLVAAGEIGVRGIAPDEARRLLDEAIGIARNLGLPKLFARAVLARAYRAEIVGLSDDALVALLDEAARGLPEALPALVAQLRSRAAIEVRYAPGGLPRALALLDEARALAERSREPRSIAQVLEDASLVRWSVADPQGWLSLNHAIVAAATRAGDVELGFQGLKGIATAKLELGDRGGFDRALADCEATAGECPSPFLRSVVSSLHAARAFLDGDFGAGEQAALTAAASELEAVAPLAAGQLYYHRLETGRLHELEGAVRAFADDSPGVATWRVALARLLVDGERADEARAEITGVGPLGAMARDRNWYPAIALLAECAALMYDAELAEQVASQLEPYARVSVVLGNGALYYGNGAHFLGIVYMTLGRLDEAATLLDTAFAAHDAMRSEPWRLRTRAEQALLLARQGEVEAGRTLSAETSERAQAIGMQRCAERAGAAPSGA